VELYVIVSNKMPYIVLIGRWCNIIVLNVRTSISSEDKRDNSEDIIGEELEQVFLSFS
jgi:hypothetical protein